MLCAVLQQVMVGAYVYSTYEVVALRGQAESQAKHEGLYTRRSKDWISWEEVPFRPTTLSVRVHHFDTRCHIAPLPA